MIDILSRIKWGKPILFILSFFVVWSVFLFCGASDYDPRPGQENDIKSALETLEDMKAEIQQAHSKLAKTNEGDDLSVMTLTSKSVPNLKSQFNYLVECIGNILEESKSSSEIQRLSSELAKVEAIMNELDRVSKSNLKSASQDQLNKLSLALDALQEDLSETEKFVLRSKIEELKKSLKGDLEDMEEEVKDAFDRLAKAQEGDDLYEICLTSKNLPNLKKSYDSLSQKIKQAKENFQSSQEIQKLSSDLSKTGTILQELERVGKANLKADSEAQLEKLSESISAFQSRLK